jgi:[protein-PII] uridylyltransferase
MRLDREELLADENLTGAAWCRAYSDLVDTWLAKLMQNAVGSVAAHGVALVATGGYGRAELSPQSDLDVMLLHSGRADIGPVADRLWYPIWDTGLKLGHSVRTVRTAVALAGDDLDTATALLSVRHLAGDTALTTELEKAARDLWRKQSKWWLTELGRRVEERHQSAGEVAFLLEPDLKEARGGLRDVHALRWAEAASLSLLDEDITSLTEAYGVLLDARVELHRRTGRPSNQLVLQEQDAVAAALGLRDADELMARIASAARVIAWISDDSWRKVSTMLRGRLARRAGKDRVLGPGVVVRASEIHLTETAPVERDPCAVLRLGVLAVTDNVPLSRDALYRLASAPPLPEPWPQEARDLLVQLLLAGPAAIDVIEALDQRGLWVRVLPEWAPTRAKPQRNAYHRFTVDRHLIEAATGAARLAGTVGRPDLLVVGTLLHDIGKGYPGDHTEVGMDLVRTMAVRMGYEPRDVDTLVAMVEHHLLLPDVATRRDLDDPATVDRVAAAVGSVERLVLLAALTEADSLATGPAAWGPWKAGLVRDLVERVTHVLGGGELQEIISGDFPNAEQRACMARGALHVDGDDDVLTVIAPDRPGLFSRVAGVLALHGLAVLGAQAWSSEDGMAINQWTVERTAERTPPWAKVRCDVDRALAGKLALQARLDEKARAYTRRSKVASPTVTRVSFDNEASATATVVDVHAPDRIGVLYWIARSLAEMDLDIRAARIQTLGAQVLDAFYVRDGSGAKITDAEHLAEIERAILSTLGR